MPIETYEVREGQRVDIPSGVTPPGASDQSDAAGAGATGVPGATDSSPAGAGQTSESPPETPPASPGEGGADTDDDEPLRDDSEVNAERLNRRFARLTRLRRQAERQVEDERQRHALELAQTRGELEALTRMLSGAAPALPETPVPPTGPPQAEQYASHEDYVLAAARYGAREEMQARDQQTAQERQQAHQAAFQQQLLEREQTFKQTHPDFDDRVRAGLAGKVSPTVQQALMLIPDGPAVAYALATQPALVTRLNTLPPPLVLVELGRLSPPSTLQTPGTPTPATLDQVQGRLNGSAPTSPAQPLPMPLVPLSGSSAGTPTGTWQEGMSQEAYRAWRKRTSDLQEWKNR